MKNRFSLLVVLMLLLAACNTTVIDEEDRKLPEPTPPAAEEDADAMDEEEMDDEDEGEMDDDDAEEMDDDMEEEMDDDEEEEMDDDEDEDEEEDDDADDAEEVADTDEEAEEEPAAEAMAYTADASQSFIAFTGSKGSLSSHEGKFDSYTFKLEKAAGASNFAGGSLSVSIDINSMVTDSDGLTKHLLNEDFFEATTYPKATFVSTSIENINGSDYTIFGDLTIKGVTNSVSLPATITDAYLTTSYNLDRTAFGVGAAPEGVKAIDATVPVEGKIVFNQ